jgi:hypothetical protein
MACALRTRLSFDIARCADVDRLSIGELVYANRRARLPKRSQ